jgi:soluble lytic murein transglycosylase-like protein
LKPFCFKLGICIALAGGLYAGDIAAPSVRMQSVVSADARTGKLVRSVVVTPKAVSRQTVTANVVAPHVVTPVDVTVTPPAAAPASAAPNAADGIDSVVQTIAAQNSLPPQLIHSVIKVESNYNPNAISPKGALGLMQLIPATARRFGVSDVFDPVENIQGGARYLKYLLDLYKNDYRLALAAYNAGEAAVAKYGDVPPYAETRNYLVQVRKHIEESQKASAEAARKQEAKPVAPKPEAPRQIQQVVDADGTVRYVAR